MQVTSVNVANRQSIQLGNKTSETGIFKNPVDDAIQVTELGLQGDTIANKKHHGGHDQAVYLYSAEDYAWWSQQLGKSIGVGTFGENLTLTNLGEPPLRIGDRFQINDVILEVTAPRIPCSKLASRMDDPGFVKRFVDAGRPGAYTRVIQTGTLRAGDAVTYIPADSENITLLDLYTLFLAKQRDLETARKALEAPVAERSRAALEEWLA
jgi:MOSC domain-containing protein YiiM